MRAMFARLAIAGSFITRGQSRQGQLGALSAHVSKRESSCRDTLASQCIVAPGAAAHTV